MDLLKENIPLLVRKLAIPASVGTLFQTLYNIVDTFYSGLISPEALSALSKSFPIYFIIVATSIGVTVGGTSLIGNSIGEKNDKNASYYFTHIIIYRFIFFKKGFYHNGINRRNHKFRTSIYKYNVLWFISFFSRSFIKLTTTCRR